MVLGNEPGLALGHVEVVGGAMVPTFVVYGVDVGHCRFPLFVVRVQERVESIVAGATMNSGVHERLVFPIVHPGRELALTCPVHRAIIHHLILGHG